MDCKINMWKVYILECADKTLYCGITTNLERRVEEHNSSELGAKYTSGRRPVKLVYVSDFEDRSDATREERRIKKLTRGEKLDMIKKYDIMKR